MRYDEIMNFLPTTYFAFFIIGLVMAEMLLRPALALRLATLLRQAR